MDGWMDEALYLCSLRKCPLVDMLELSSKKVLKGTSGIPRDISKTFSEIGMNSSFLQ